MRQLNLEVSSFLSDPFHSFENRLLPNDVILLTNIGEGHEILGEKCGGREDQQEHPRQAGEAQSNSSSSSLPRSSGLACSKTDDQDSSGLCFNFTHMDGKIIS